MELKSPIIDFTYLEGILKLSKGNPRFVSESVQKFLVSAPVTIRELQRFKLDHNRDVMKQKAHKFISSCSIVGAMRMINVCYQLSSKGKTEDEVVLRGWIDQLNREFEMASEALNEYLSKIMADV